MIKYKFVCNFFNQKDFEDSISAIMFYLKDVGKLNKVVAGGINGNGDYDGEIISDVSLSENDIRTMTEIGDDNGGFIKFIDFNIN